MTMGNGPCTMARLLQVLNKAHISEVNFTNTGNSCNANGGGVTAEGITIHVAAEYHPRTSAKRSKIAFIVTYVARDPFDCRSRLLGLPAQSCRLLDNVEMCLVETRNGHEIRTMVRDFSDLVAIEAGLGLGPWIFH